MNLLFSIARGNEKGCETAINRVAGLTSEQALLRSTMEDALQETLNQSPSAGAPRSLEPLQTTVKAAPCIPSTKGDRLEFEFEEEPTCCNSALLRGRRSLGDQWYVSRHIACSQCQQPIRANLQERRGMRCSSTLKWFHDACMPAFMKQEPQLLDALNPLTAECHQSNESASVRAGLLASAREHWTDRMLPGNRSISIVDIHGVRQAMQQQQQQSREVESRQEVVERKQQAPVLFKALPPNQLRRLRAEASLSKQTKLKDGGGKRTMVVGGLQDIRSVAAVFNHCSRDLGDLDGVLEDGWAVLLRHNDMPASAATLNVFADDHARIQAIVTAPHARRMGHASILLSEVEAWLACNRVPRLVAAVPNASHSKETSGRRLLSKHSFKPLQDLSLLAEWKDTWRSYYCGALLGPHTEILVKSIKL